MNSTELCAKLRAEGDSAAEAYCGRHAFGGTEYTYIQEGKQAARNRDPMWLPTSRAVEAGISGEALTAHLDKIEAEMRVAMPDYSALIRHNAELAAARREAEEAYGAQAVNVMIYAPDPMAHDVFQAATAPAITPPPLPESSEPGLEGSSIANTVSTYILDASDTLTGAKDALIAGGGKALSEKESLPIIGVLIAGIALLVIVGFGIK